MKSQIAVFGLGYVGCVTGACLSSLGHPVVGVDKDDFKVRSIREGRSPFYEPGLDELVEQNVRAGRFTATTSAAEALEQARIAILCVGTPSEKNGNLGLEQLRRVTAEIGELLAARTEPLIVAVRSTVFPGTCEQIVIPNLGHPDRVRVVSNPEFLREGNAIDDFLKPALIVVGGEDRAAVEELASLYAPLNVEPCLVSLRTAEMIKYACNAFHAVKIAFANEIGALASDLGIAGEEVMDTLCRDTSLNISRAYLKPGFAFGGSCLPKDLRALIYRASRMDMTVPLLESVTPSNDEHLNRATNAVLELGPVRIGVFGLAFKENTDDLRESPIVRMLETLIGKGRDVRIFDPHIQLDQIYGSNQRYVLNAIPHIGKLMVPRIEDLLAWADHIVVPQKPSAALAEKLLAAGKPVMELYRLHPKTSQGAAVAS